MIAVGTYWNILPEPHTGAAEDLGGVLVHMVPLAVDDLADANLDNLDAAREAGARVAVEYAALADALAARLEEGVLLGVQAQAGGQGGARGLAGVAARAPALGAVAHAPGSAVVPRAHDAARGPHDDAAHAPLHAVGALRRQGRQRHEVGVPRRPEAVRVRQV